MPENSWRKNGAVLAFFLRRPHFSTVFADLRAAYRSPAIFVCTLGCSPVFPNVHPISPMFANFRRCSPVFPCNLSRRLSSIRKKSSFAPGDAILSPPTTPRCNIPDRLLADKFLPDDWRTVVARCRLSINDRLLPFIRRGSDSIKRRLEIDSHAAGALESMSSGIPSEDTARRSARFRVESS